MIVSPLNYSGNKAKILKHIIPLFPQDVNVFADIFCGSGIVGLNSPCETLLLNDKEKRILNLLKYFKTNDLDKILFEIANLIQIYDLTDTKSKPKGYYKIYANEGLSKYNKDGFLKLRKDYNEKPNDIKLFVLILYGFNHYLRFNSKNLFNVPVGKMDFSKSLYDKTIEFIKFLQEKNIKFTNLDFRDENLYKTADFFYFDPPYLITNAPYNASWSQKDENDLYEILDFLNSKNKKFAFSNVIFSNGKTNEKLKIWSKKYQICEIKRQYTNANYRRKNLSNAMEVLIKNY
ncbi:DNA adenine methylase [Campylobacter sp. JMF_04 NA10]|uniref:DNA adenine methylase n=1 Tax=Campylobacter sp. JMF_04 NA10 TaxID=2983824 RepID=UPI0022E9D97B|nr:DNA adenine methylase [Campylobacter sp. JMF_04 NA10]MDA3077076.1 DNA adenine methylase [Campylobacter sp. JMF_04 NA10]